MARWSLATSDVRPRASRLRSPPPAAASSAADSALGGAIAGGVVEVRLRPAYVFGQCLSDEDDGGLAQASGLDLVGDVAESAAKDDFARLRGVGDDDNRAVG